ncbi:hypothetical protein GCM10027591_01580 [Zhihengliuella somnathii]
MRRPSTTCQLTGRSDFDACDSQCMPQLVSTDRAETTRANFIRDFDSSSYQLVGLYKVARADNETLSAVLPAI